MSALPLLRRTLALTWRGMIGWSLGLAAVVALYMPLYRSIGCDASFAGLIDRLPPQLVRTIGYEQFTTGAGFVERTVYGLLGFVLSTIAATAWGASAIAGDEERGDLEGVLAVGAGFVAHALLVGSASLAMGAVSGRRALAIGAGAGVAIAGYALNALGNQSADLEWMHAMSPYHWALGNDPLATGFADSATGLANLVGGSMLLTMVGLAVFRRRDIGV